MLPEVRYVRSGGASIAYETFGAGPPDVVFAPGFVSQLDLAWEEPSLARFLRRLGSFSRVIWFDRVGTGLSDARPGAPSLADGVRDLEAVMDAAGCARAALFGVAVGAGLCVHHAVEHGERVSGLVLLRGTRGCCAAPTTRRAGPRSSTPRCSSRSMRDGVAASSSSG